LCPSRGLGQSEAIDSETVMFAIAMVVTVLVGQHMRIARG
jgi:hypothetical protein